MRLILGLIVLLILAAGATAGYSAVLEDSEIEYNITNESWTPDAGNITTLNNSNLEAADYESTVTVRNQTDALMTEPSDYTWFENNGTILTNTTGSLAGDTTANISYNYTQPPENQVRLASAYSNYAAFLGWAVLLVPVLLLIKFIGGA